jgi:hypothetical protein
MAHVFDNRERTLEEPYVKHRLHSLKQPDAIGSKRGLRLRNRRPHLVNVCRDLADLREADDDG